MSVSNISRPPPPQEALSQDPKRLCSLLRLQLRLIHSCQSCVRDIVFLGLQNQDSRMSLSSLGTGRYFDGCAMISTLHEFHVLGSTFWGALLHLVEGVCSDTGFRMKLNLGPTLRVCPA